MTFSLKILVTGWSGNGLFLLGFLDLFLPKIQNHLLVIVLVFILVTIFPDYTAKTKLNSLFIQFPQPWSHAVHLLRALRR